MAGNNGDVQLMRRLNALTRTQEQRNKIRQSLLNNNGEDLDERHDGFFLTRNRNQIRYNLPNGEYLVLITSQAQKNEIMNTEMRRVENMGKGINNLYYSLKQKYLNLTREDVKNYLQNSSTYVLSQKPKPRVNKSIVSSVKEKNKLWAIDLIEMDMHFDDANQIVEPRGRANNRIVFKYIFSCIDIFSRKIWLEPLTSKETDEYTTQALNRIIQRAGVAPSGIIVDNGTEFKGAFEQYCKDRNIKIRRTRSYTPQANPAEASNKQVRETLRHLLTRNRNLKWYDQLRNVELARNSSFHSGIRATPNEVYDNENANNDEIIERNTQKAKDKQKKYKTTLFEVGDRVFISTEAVYSKARSKVKSGWGKTIQIKFVPLIWRITKVIRPSNNVVERHRYEIETAYAPHRQLMNKQKPARIYASDLVKCTLTKNNLNITVEKAREMNGIEETRNDLVW